MKSPRFVGLASLCLLVAVILLEPTQTIVGRLKGEVFFQNRPTTYWSRQLRSGDPAREASCREQLLSGGSASVDVLIELLVDQRGSAWQAAEVRWKAAELLGEIGGSASASQQTLLAALGDSDPHVRSVAATALPLVGTSSAEAVPALTRMLNSDARLAAARSLSAYGPEAQPAMNELIALLSDQQLDSEIRWNAARTLGKLRAAGLDALPVLVAHLHDEAATVREHSAEAIGDLGPGAKSAVEDLVGVLGDPATRVRRDAVRSLGYIGGEARAALSSIKPLFDDPEQIVRDAAVTAWKTIAPDEPLPKPVGPPQMK